MRPELARVCVFPGRFQPFHNGHAAGLTHAASNYERVVVAISNAHVSHTASDPFTGGERYEMIAAWARALSIWDRLDVIPVPVDDEPTAWVATIRAIAPGFGCVYTRSAWTRALFDYWGFPNSDSLIQGHSLSASEVRASMAAGGAWRSLVPLPVAEIIEACGGVSRVADLSDGKNHRLHTGAAREPGESR
ncbi:adenylyltransferase/cytidyltransferase family protein [Streptomyces sp. NPDC048341]|uniref:adenylyltransferase/cytidyltransferase family protein n=1 Tax=Streptomyces sp. NPDC048341 TaxID=3154620 RepID=UPI003429FC61